MVQPGARRVDDDLRAVTDRTGRVEGRAVTASSRGVRGRLIHQTYSTVRGNSSSDVGLGRDSGTSRSEKAVRVGFMSVMIKIAGSQQERPEKSRPPTNPMQRKKSKNDSWEQTCPTDGGPQDLVIVPSYSGHVAGCIWGGQSDLHISDSNIGINAQDLAGVADSPRKGLSTEQRVACYVLYLLGSLLFTDKSANNVPGKLWPLVKNVSSVGGFAWGLDIPVFSYVRTSGESGSEVVQTLHPEVCDVGSQNGEQINLLTHSFRHDDYRRGQVDSVQI
ncbi:hypothetical protein M9H77_32116 [Catharanthus roseus]|uniref:Uncharacterized protein n=1 Tax=Catharanthus roseus TaxID=4058 RepID=A0ACC0A421_CATRO|nr:hypothetical protein M9H77_32116 [Catharanthus roseus]